MEFKVEDFHLVHVAERRDISLLKKILKDKALLSTASQGEDPTPGLEGDEEKVHMGLIMPNKQGKTIMSGRPIKDVSCVYFILNPKLIQDAVECGDNLHYCKTWNNGETTGCAPYNPSKSLLQNLIDWRNSHITSERKNAKFDLRNGTIYGTPFNEIAIRFSKDGKGNCLDGVIPLDRYLQAIYVPKQKKFLKLYDEIKEFSKNYPQYNWIFEE